MASILALSGVGVRRQGNAILSGVDWAIEAGQRWVVLGPNGAGKTTLLRIATGYLVPSDGAVELLGRRLGTFDIREVRARIGVAGAALDALIGAHRTPLEIVSPAPGAPSTRGGIGTRPTSGSARGRSWSSWAAAPWSSARTAASRAASGSGRSSPEP